MGSPSIAPWTSAIKAVEQLFDAPASDLTLSDVRDMEASLYALMRGAPLPHADMEQLVWELKVCAGSQSQLHSGCRHTC